MHHGEHVHARGARAPEHLDDHALATPLMFKGVNQANHNLVIALDVIHLQAGHVDDGRLRMFVGNHVLEPSALLIQADQLILGPSGNRQNPTREGHFLSPTSSPVRLGDHDVARQRGADPHPRDRDRFAVGPFHGTHVSRALARDREPADHRVIQEVDRQARARNPFEQLESGQKAEYAFEQVLRLLVVGEPCDDFRALEGLGPLAEQMADHLDRRSHSIIPIERTLTGSGWFPQNDYTRNRHAPHLNYWESDHG